MGGNPGASGQTLDVMDQLAPKQEPTKHLESKLTNLRRYFKVTTDEQVFEKGLTRLGLNDEAWKATFKQMYSTFLVSRVLPPELVMLHLAKFGY